MRSQFKIKARNTKWCVCSCLELNSLLSLENSDVSFALQIRLLFLRFSFKLVSLASTRQVLHEYHNSFRTACKNTMVANFLRGNAIHVLKIMQYKGKWKREVYGDGRMKNSVVLSKNVKDTCNTKIIVLAVKWRCAIKN